MARMAAIPSTPRVVISLLDITHLRRAEQKILATNEMLRSLTSELVMTEERERRRIAVELHDHIAQTLALAKMEMDALSHRAAGSGMEASCGRISDMLRQSIQETRSLIREISPSVLYELGLNEAVLWLADQFQSKHGLDVNVADGLGNEELEQDLQVLLFRTVRELLMNVVKHARAGKAWVTLEQVADNIAVSVRDDGSGFHMSGSSQDEQEMGGFGLFSIRERVRHLGGRLIIESAEGKGTRVRLEVPKRNRT
jgi:signal transduction histidine kinase